MGSLIQGNLTPLYYWQEGGAVDQNVRLAILTEQLTAIRNMASKKLSAQDRLQLAQGSCLLLQSVRTELGLPGEISTVRQTTSLADSLQWLVEEDQATAEET